MVGIPRSTGCQTCVRRRVKCDEAQPACGNCIRYRASCPGYNRPLKFVTGKHPVRARRKGRPTHTALELPDGAGAGAGAGASDGTLSLPGVTNTGAGTGTSSSGRPATWSPTASEMQLGFKFAVMTNPASDRGQVICTIIGSIAQTQAAHDFRVFAPWFDEVPRHLGRKAVLDSAMAAFSLHLLGKAREDESLVHESRSVYGQSLAALQRALNHPVEWKSSETLCATMILCLFELFAGTIDADSWRKHATGVSWLVQQRGPEAHKDPWDRSMLLSFRAFTIMNALFSGQDCFLAKRSWEKVLASPDPRTSPGPQHEADATATELYAIADSYYTYLARVPGVLHRGYAVREARRHGLSIDPSQIATLVRRAEKLRSEVAALFARYTKLAPAPVEVPSADPASIHDTVLSYSTVWHGSLYMSWWATLLILQECLVQGGYPVDYTASNRELARNIYLSVEYVGAGMMGPFRVGYPLRIAYEFANVRTQMWIGTVLARFQKHYAATSPATYPKPGGNEDISTRP